MRRLEAYILREDYAGYDPYDGLMSPLFRLPLLRSAKLLRLPVQQVVKRLPVNIRPLLGVRKGRNPVTYGLCLQAFACLMRVYPSRKDFYRTQAQYCLHELARLQSPGYSGACWGYDFDWEARYASIPRFTPTVVATGFVTNALMEYYRIEQSTQAAEMCESAAAFVLHDLRRSYQGTTFCFSYSPLDTQAVLNATMKGARLLAQVSTITGKTDLLSEAKNTVQFVLACQNADGSWPYSKGDARSWTDSFHTGYVLDCLDEYSRCSGDTSVQPYLQLGLDFYKTNFFLEDGTVKYYHDRAYPIDSTAVAQSLLTLARFGSHERAHRVAEWAVRHMQNRRGYFYFQKTKRYTNRISYMRWSNAWMYAALARYLRDSG